MYSRVGCSDLPVFAGFGRSGSLLVPRGFGGDMLPHIPATRAMFTYPCSGKTTLGRLVGCM